MNTVIYNVPLDAEDIPGTFLTLTLEEYDEEYGGGLWINLTSIDRGHNFGPHEEAIVDLIHHIAYDADDYSKHDTVIMQFEVKGEYRESILDFWPGLVASVLNVQKGGSNA